jgi:hypothetical protein
MLNSISRKTIWLSLFLALVLGIGLALGVWFVSSQTQDAPSTPPSDAEVVQTQTSNNGLGMFVIIASLVVAGLMLAILFAGIKRVTSTRYRTKAKKAADEADGGGKNATKTVSTPAPSGKKEKKYDWSFSTMWSSMVKTVKGTVIVIVLLGVGAFFLILIGGLCIIVIEAVKASPRQTPQLAVANTRNSQPATWHNESTPPLSLPSIAPNAQASVRSQHLSIDANWFRIPKTASGTNDWNIQRLNFSDKFVMRGEKGGRDIGCWDFYSGTFPDADVYYIRCINKNRTEVLWTEDRK